MASIIRNFLYFRNLMKIYHWHTTSYPRHLASDALITGIDTLIDQFMEVYLGKNPRITIADNTSTPLFNVTDKEATTVLGEFKDYLMGDLISELDVSTGREPMSNPDLLSIRDEMLSLVNKTIYLFSLN